MFRVYNNKKGQKSITLNLSFDHCLHIPVHKNYAQRYNQNFLKKRTRFLQIPQVGNWGKAPKSCTKFATLQEKSAFLSKSFMKNVYALRPTDVL